MKVDDIDINIPLNSRKKAFNLIKIFAEALNVKNKLTDAEENNPNAVVKAVRDLNLYFDKLINREIEPRIQAEIKEDLEKKWKEENGDTNSSAFFLELNFQLRNIKEKYEKDDAWIKKQKQRQKINEARDIYENKTRSFTTRPARSKNSASNEFGGLFSEESKIECVRCGRTEKQSSSFGSFCSDKCFRDWLEENKAKVEFRPCINCGRIKLPWKKANKDEKEINERFYCSNNCSNKEPYHLEKMRKKYALKLEEMDGFSLLIFEERKNFISQIKNENLEINCKKIISDARFKIRKKKTIQEIQNELEKINLKESEPSYLLEANWEIAVDESNSLENLESLKLAALDKILAVNKKNRKEYANTAILQIKNKLFEIPRVTDQELNDINWEETISNLTDENKFQTFLNKLSTEISKIRELKICLNSLNESIQNDYYQTRKVTRLREELENFQYSSLFKEKMQTELKNKIDQQMHDKILGLPQSSLLKVNFIELFFITIFLLAKNLFSKEGKLISG